MDLRERKYLSRVCRVAVSVSLLFLAGCSELDYMEDDGVITFDNSSLKDEVSRGAILSAFSSDDSFGSFAYSVKTGEDFTTEKPDLMDNTKVTLSEEGKWEYSPMAMWSDYGYDSHFVGYAPYNDPQKNGITATVPTDGGYPIIRYDMPIACADQPDLMVATLSRVCFERDAVNFKFSHQLASILFQVKGNVEMTIQKLELKGVVDGGDLTYDGSKWSWTNPTISDDGYVAGIDVGVEINEETAIVITQDDGCLMVIPQEITESVTLDITYTNEKNPNGAEELMYSSISLPEGGIWSGGNKYLYTITLENVITIEGSGVVGQQDMEDGEGIDLGSIVVE